MNKIQSTEIGERRIPGKPHILWGKVAENQLKLAQANKDNSFFMCNQREPWQNWLYKQLKPGNLHVFTPHELALFPLGYRSILPALSQKRMGSSVKYFEKGSAWSGPSLEHTLWARCKLPIAQRGLRPQGPGGTMIASLTETARSEALVSYSCGPKQTKQ